MPRVKRTTLVQLSREVPEDFPDGHRINTKTFQLSGKNLFLTFAKCYLSKEQMLKNILDDDKITEKGIKSCVVAKEDHKDGTPHLHVLLCLNNAWDSTSARVFDHLAGQHGNYLPVRSLNRTILYVAKKGDFIQANADQCSDPFSDAQLAGKESAEEKKWSKVAQMAAEGKGWRDIMHDDPAFYAQNSRKIKEFVADWETDADEHNRKSALLKWSVIPLDKIKFNGSNGGGVGMIARSAGVAKGLTKWLNENLFVERKRKQEWLWLYGETNCGKTTFLDYLRKFCREYVLPKAEDFMDGYNDKAFDLITADEFTGSFPITFMNTLIEGAPLKCKQKGRDPVLKLKAMPGVICSNRHPSEFYEKVDKATKDAFLGRFKIIEVNKDLMMPKLVEHWNMIQNPQDYIDGEEDDAVMEVEEEVEVDSEEPAQVYKSPAPIEVPDLESTSPPLAESPLNGSNLIDEEADTPTLFSPRKGWNALWLRDQEKNAGKGPVCGAGEPNASEAFVARAVAKRNDSARPLPAILVPKKKKGGKK